MMKKLHTNFKTQAISHNKLILKTENGGFSTFAGYLFLTRGEGESGPLFSKSD